MDIIRITNLRLRMYVGILEWEQRVRQDVCISIALHTDLRQAQRTDAIEDTIDYKTIKRKVMDHLENNRFGLIEKVAGDVADICLADPKVVQVDVVVDKLGALRYADSVSVEISRRRS